MVFWAGILAGGLFIWLAIRIGFYEMWAMLFNIVISIYVAIFLAPVIIEIVPAANEMPCCEALALVVTSAGTFLILYGITYIFLTGQFKVSFPKTFDILFSGVLGFLAGFLVLSFAALVITATPISQNQLVSQAGLNKKSQQANISYICWWGDLVNSIVSAPENEISTKQAIDGLLSSTESKARPQRTAEPAGPNKTPEPNGAETSTGQESQLSTPPEATAEDP